MIKFRDLRDAKVWPLMVVPVVLLILSRIFVHMAGRFPDDPEYSYLLNGLEVLTFYPPSYISHPGTPLIMLTAVVNLFAWLVALPFHRLGLVTDVLSKPLYYLGVNNAILVMAIAAATFWFANRVSRASGSVVAGLAGQVSVLLFSPAMIALSRVAPEPLLLASTLVIAGLVAPLAFGRCENTKQTATATGIVVGFSIATKITALPLVLILLFLPGWELRKRAGLFVIASLIFFTLPAAHHYPQMLSWFTGMATHSGSYSDGAPGLPPVAKLLSYTLLLFRQAPELFVALVTYAGLAVLGPPSLRRFMGISALVVAAQILVVIKSPGSRYLIPVIGVFALANAGIVAALLPHRALWAKIALAAVVFAGLCNNAVSGAAWARFNRRANIENRKLMERVSASGCGVVLYYEAQLEIYDLDFGNQYAGSRFGAALQRIYPESFTYDWARRSFMFFGTPLSPAELQARLAPARCIYLVGSPLERFGADSEFGIPRSSLTPVMGSDFDGDQSLAVYRYRP